MNILSISISGVFFVCAVTFTVFLLVSILGNLKAGRKYRQNLLAKVSNLRLSRMLALHRIDQDTYLHSQPVVDIENHIKRCAGCSRTDQCDEVLSADAQDKTAFCDNDEDLQTIKRKQEAAA
jgi:hypothetical protein